ncbi:pyruvate, phosphate dikinase [Pedococcus bigeumensis]|uniref:pyruvate, phosphate dikinase n=1 Tax=Pedococcus bigeumensis TaxID=433644 RepID=UPI002FE923AE
MTTPLLLPFALGDASMVDLLGGKGANLAEMTRLGLPVPPGFTITTEACRRFLDTEELPPELPDLVSAAVIQLETQSGRTFGSTTNPLLVSVRSGGRFSMPGMMETVLNVGLTDATLPGLAARGGWRFAWDCYRRLVQMYGHTVLGVEAGRFDELISDARTRLGAVDDAHLPATALEDLVRQFRRVLAEDTGQDLPQEPRVQLDAAIGAVFRSWNGDRAKTYRAHEGIPDHLGTAVNVVEMVFGNTGHRSGSGVCFTRNPSTGSAAAYGDYLPDAQGEDVVNGSRETMPLDELGTREPELHRQLLAHLTTLERHYRDLCDVEFTVEDGRLWLLQTRVGKRSPAAAFRIAADLADEGLITVDEALWRVDGHQLESLLHPRFADLDGQRPLATGLPASPGAAVGVVAFDAAAAVAARARGQAPVLVRMETSPDDLAGMIASEAVVTARGGLTSHAAVVARGLGRTCVTSVGGLVIESAAFRATTADGQVIVAGEVVSVDGTTGRVYRGALDVRPSPVARALEDGADPEASPLVLAVTGLLRHADARRTLRVRANAETEGDARLARRLGAEGIGLCRTEHMLLGARRELVERVVLDDRRDDALAEIEAVALDEFTRILRAMDGLPVVVRLLDPPLHEFLPDLVGLAIDAAHREDRHEHDETQDAKLAAVRRWHETNPMLGLRGVRLLTVVPELVVAHVRALARAQAALRAEGLDPRPEVMVPLVATESELELAARHIEAGWREGDPTTTIPVGTMIELPRAALIADSLARTAEFFSFGTNDLTQTTWGVSRDDAEGSFLAAYRREGILTTDPFTTLDERGVGQLVRTAVQLGRSSRPTLGLGACGEHAGDPASIHFFAGLGLDYVSCSPPRVPVARLEAGRAALHHDDKAGADTR